MTEKIAFSEKQIKGLLVECQKQKKKGITIPNDMEHILEIMIEYETGSHESNEKKESPNELSPNELSKESPKKLLDIDCWNMFFSLCDSNNELIQRALQFMIETGSNRLNENIYTSVIKCLCDYGRMDEAFLTYQNMKKRGIIPHLRTFNGFFNDSLSYDLFGKLCVEIMNYKLIPSLDMFSKMIECTRTLSRTDDEEIIGEEIEEKIEEDNRDPFSLVIDWISVFYDAVNIKVLESIQMIVLSGTTSNIDRSGNCLRCWNKLERRDLTDSERNLFLTTLGKEFKNIKTLQEYVKNQKHYDVIIDGANVALYNNSPSFDVKKIENIISHFIQRNKRILIVFNINRKNQVKSITEKNKELVNFYYSERGQNDDLFWLYCGFYYKNALVVTDDKMCDHIFRIFNNLGIHKFWKWAHLNVARFHFDKTKCLTIQYPKWYSEKVQFVNGILHVPVKRGKEKIEWVCFGEENNKNNFSKRERSVNEDQRGQGKQQQGKQQQGKQGQQVKQRSQGGPQWKKTKKFKHNN